MATRSHIIVKRASDWARIYVHSDGYPSHNGRILFDHYQGQKKAEALIRLGDLSVLGPEIGKKHDFDWTRSVSSEEYKTDPRRNYCRAYGRDRREKGVKAEVADTLMEIWPDEQYAYVWADGLWRAARPERGVGGLRVLKDVLLNEEILDNADTFILTSALAAPASNSGQPANWGEF